MPPIHPPDEMTAEDWLLAFDNEPTLTPAGLPESDRMALIVVIDRGGEDTEAYYVRDPEMLAVISNPDQPWGLKRLFFLVPRSILNRPGVCPNLT